VEQGIVQMAEDYSIAANIYKLLVHCC